MEYSLTKLKPDTYLFDFKNKVIVQLKIRLGEKGEIGGKYGPYLNFLKFSLPLRQEKGKIVSNVVACRYILLSLDDALFEKAEIEAVDWMRREEKNLLFSCDDALLNRTMQLCKNTLHACLEPHYLGNATIHLQPQKSRDFANSWHGESTDYVIYDGARRDREVWVGDLLPEIRTVWDVFEDGEVIENTLNVIFDQMRPDGNIPASSISACEFIEYNAWFLIVFYEYILLSGRVSYLEEKYKKLKKIAEFLENSLREGVLEVPRGRTWAWTLSREGKITGSNCVAARAFFAAGVLFDREPPLSRYYRALSERLKTTVAASAYDEDAHLLRDTLDCKDARYSLDSNALAVCFDVLPQEKKLPVLQAAELKFANPYGRLLMSPQEPRNGINWIHNAHVWPFCVSMQVEALFSAGESAKALALIRQTWGCMVRQDADTCWEIVDGETGGFMRERLVDAEDERDTWNSACHGWSAGLPHLLNEYVAGVVPETYGYAQCRFHPDLCDLQRISTKIPTGFGTLCVYIENNVGVYEIELDVPKQCFLKCDVEDLMAQSGERIPIGARIESGKYFAGVNGNEVRDPKFSYSVG